MAGYLAIRSDFGAFLNFDEGADSRVVTYLAPIQVHEGVQLHAFPEFDVGGYLQYGSFAVLIINAQWRLCPPRSSATVAASRIRTTARPSLPLESGQAEDRHSQ